MVRRVERLEDAVMRQDGDGLPVRRALPLDALAHANPFLLVEEIGPVAFAAGDVRTAPPHPVRGVEQVTWVLEGSVDHIRSGGRTTIAVNEAEWATAGGGDLYREEFPEARVWCVRVWISLPRGERRTSSEALTSGSNRDSLGSVTVDLLAGNLLAARPRIQSRSRVTVARLQVGAGTTFVHAVDSLEPGREAPTVVLFGLTGRARIGPGPAGGADEWLVSEHQIAVLAPPAIGPAAPPRPNTDEVRIRTDAAAFDALWLSGLPVGVRAAEPFVQRGPFTLRTEEEVLQAVEDYRTGRFGTL